MIRCGKMIGRLARLAVVAALVGLAGPASADPIPGLANLPSDLAAARPDLVAQRAALEQERAALRAKFDSHNARCSSVEQGSAQEAPCRGAQGSLASSLAAHVRKTNGFNAGARTAIAVATKPAPATLQPTAARYSPDHIVVPSPPIVPECTSGATCDLERIDKKASEFLWDRTVWLHDAAHRGWVGDAINFILFPSTLAGVLETFGTKLAIGGSSSALGASAEASLWQDRLPGVQLRQVGDWWVKRVNPEANPVMQWWGRASINAQHEGLQALGDMATPSQMRNGMLFTRDTGPALPDGNRFLNPIARDAYLKGSVRMGTFFNDIQPRNMGANGLIFDPAIDPVAKTIPAAGVAGTAAAVHELNK